MEIQLVNASHEHVAHVQIPAFDPQPGVIVWGDRLFVRLSHEQYVEAFYYVVPFVAENASLPSGATPEGPPELVPETEAAPAEQSPAEAAPAPADSGGAADGQSSPA